MSDEATTTRTCEGAVTTGAQAPIPEDVIEIPIARDLAVTLVGSDAGKEKRMKPHSAMTKGATPEEIAAVENVMSGFLEQEIARVHNKPAARPSPTYLGVASVDEAKALKAFCARLADSLKQHLIGKGDDDRHYRSRQRLDQARAVISQINTALGLPPEEGRPVAECVQDVLAEMVRLRDHLRDLHALCTRRQSPASELAILSAPAREIVGLLTLPGATAERVDVSRRPT